MQGFDPRKPNVARMYDHYLGGKDNFAADREAAKEIMRLSPGAVAAAHDNRRFLGRAVGYVARSGVIQFIDIGAGLPTMENTHEIAVKENWLSRVVYVDNDPVAVNHAMVLLGAGPQAVAIRGDLREPRQIMENAVLRSFLDTSQPVAIILAAVLHFIDDSRAYAIVDYLKDSVPPGSALVISHATADDATSTETQKVQSVYNRADSPIFLRTHDDVTRFFSGFELVEPGVVDINSWQTIGTPKESQTVGYGGVAIKL
jgi:O-methyltransferase involved in polyketide biosynthesis